MKSYLIESKYEKKIIYKNIKDYIIDKEIHGKLEKTKIKIDSYSNKWEKSKKIFNNYEYIYFCTSKKKNICKYDKSISRAFYKIHEILFDFELIKSNNQNITSIAEGPGGFIQSLIYNHSKKNITLDNINGITLKSNNNNIPDWHPIIKNNEKINILYGINDNGDICDMENIKSLIDYIGINTQDIVSCDGGIDYSNDYNNQELLSYELIYSEIILGLHIQKEMGSMVIKIFDISHYKTIQLVYLLYQSYENVYITKPHTSRNTNSEKYIVCKNHKKNNGVINIMKYYFNNKHDMMIYIPENFIKDITGYNNICIGIQIENINKILKNIDNKIIKLKPTQEQIDLSLKWCIEYNMEINYKCIYLENISDAGITDPE
jgi:23S rRNA U2552 (ribose-2'-O)-methylase RlmE/FtsJ